MKLLAYIVAFLLITLSAQAQQNILPLDVSAVATGGTAVTAIASGHRTAGGKIQNPPNAAYPLCINEIGTASGTTSAGSTTCIQPGLTYWVAPAAGAVSVISSDSAHNFSGEAYQPPPLNTTTIYIVGNGTGTITPRSTATWTAQVWGAGQSGNDITGAGGTGGGWAQKDISATSGSPLSFSLGAPGLGGHAIVSNGGDTWLSASGTLIAPGGGSSTTAIGTLTALGGVGGSYLSAPLPGGGGAGNSHGNGHKGGTSNQSLCNNGNGGGGGGGNGGGADGSGCINNSRPGGAGGAGFAGTGGAGGTTGAGSPGGPGAGGGGAAGDSNTSGGNGGDDYDNGGGGAGGIGGGQTTAISGSNGGTPGGGGTDCSSTSGVACTIGHGGWSVAKITYASSDADQIYEIGTIPMPVNVPASWIYGYTTTTPGGGITVLTRNGLPASGTTGYLMLLGVGQ